MRKKQKNSLCICNSNTAALMITNTGGSDVSSWVDLPWNLLDKIFALLSGTDRLRFGWMCSPWRGFARLSAPPFPVPFEPPRLLLPWPDNFISFFDVFKGRARSCPFPPSHRRARCLGYLLGWFVLISDQNISKVCLLNPVLALEIPLPDLEFPIRKAILSAPPGFPNCVVAVMGRSDSLALCELEGKKIWRRIGLGGRILHDIVFCQNQLCVLDKSGNVHICSFDMEARRTSVRTVQAPLPHVWTYGVKGFLVESIDSDLLVVIRHTSFVVFRLYRKCHWAALIDLGDQALFIGEVRSESVPVNRFPGSGLMKNSIYYTSRKFPRCIGPVIVYSKGTYRFSDVLVSQRYSVLADPVWISPVIWP